MDWSDDVAYSVHDVEDGVIVGRIDLRALADPAEQAALAEQGHGQHPDLSIDDAGRRRPTASELPVVADAATYDGSFAASVALKRLTSELVGRFATAAITATHESLRPRPAHPLRRRSDGAADRRRRGRACSRPWRCGT